MNKLKTAREKVDWINELNRLGEGKDRNAFIRFLCRTTDTAEVRDFLLSKYDRQHSND